MDSYSLFKTKYGYFDNTEREYVITRWETPTPWVNVISNGDYGLVVSQAGGGYSWRSHASLNRLTRWNQDLVRDVDGRFLYLRDEEATGDGKQFWSLAWQPVQPEYGFYECRHGQGYSVFTTHYANIETRWTVTVPPDAPLEIWLVRVRNLGESKRHLSLFSYLEWLLGTAPDWHREFHKTFIETSFEREAGAILATKYNWEPPITTRAHWNTDWPYVAFHAAWPTPVAFETDKQSFLGQYGSPAKPRALIEGKLQGSSGRWGDAIASLHVTLDLDAGEERTVVFLIGAADTRQEAISLVQRFTQPEIAGQALAQSRADWLGRTQRLQVDTPDLALNLMANSWLVYQTISGRLWGRSAYYQTGGAIGFRDQLQDSLVYLLLGQPEQTLAQIRLHARHQFADGSAHHWWHPLPALGASAEVESGMRTKISDNRLWLCYVLARYLEETADFAALDLAEPFVDDPIPGSLWEHCRRALDLALSQLSRRGLPLIGGGDWNDGLNAVGVEGRGESVWLGHFLYGLLIDYAGFAGYRGEFSLAQRYGDKAAALKGIINQIAWDGEWYWRASTDSGMLLGSQENAEGKIFLNAQTWAILSGLATPERAEKAMQSARQHLYKSYGPLLLEPAYSRPDPEIGYLTRYAPGLRENGGVYVHAACWAVLAERKAHGVQAAYDLWCSFCPPVRSQDPEAYMAEPYVMPGNVDGPASPFAGRAGWTWYTGSAAWYLRGLIEGVLGVKATLDGLSVQAALPNGWDGYRIQRRFRHVTYDIQVRRAASGESTGCTINDQPWKGETLPFLVPGTEHLVKFICR